MSDQSLQLEEVPKASTPKRWIIAGIAASVLIGVVVVLWLFLWGSSDEAQKPAAKTEITHESLEPKVAQEAADYVPMPRPFLFNATGDGRTRLVQIKVQLLVRGRDNSRIARKHVPLIEDAILTTFSRASIEQLATLEGKEQLRNEALQGVQSALSKVEGRSVVERVLFTGFVMQ
ncbi:flagellar basal body-associated protein FliL [Paraferrimonas sedimenticola]|uniref:Flagellar protein FliL n=1 Tax=Paraferrimonas sedimenticola TaxID=375674 RepID=A0AA37RS02_9GAMM|nr:flagellar basal body-associated protein FliL [Paraferrimonas sedimenticola]GLP94968.1 flagellar basal body-associated protein FliL [Paraferrimonas sedimenticola]